MNRNLRTPAAESDVTEQQEISEIYNLLLLANDKIESGKLKDAKALGVEALEIDETSLEVLSLLVDVNIKLRKYEEAFVYAESMIEMHPDDPLGPLCKARVQCEMKHYRDCITSSLQSLSMGYGKHKELSTLIVRAVQEILGLSEDFTESLKDMDYYSQLGEVGIVLLAAKQNILVIQILEVALKLQTMQYGVSMRIYLTQGHAFCAVQKYEAALKAYEKCYQMAVSTHDVAHQTKALVNTAALHVSLGETYKALVVYERLLDMHSRLLSDQEVCEDVWTEEFISVLHMNTSIAYKTVGNIDMALHYAQKYLRNLEQTEDFSGLSLIHKHLGTLYETVCQYSHAISHYNSFLAMAKCSGDSIQIALAYGHLGSIYGQIGLWPISLVYHDRHVCGVFNVLNSLTNADNLAKDLARINEVKKGVVQVYDMYGDTMMRRKDYEEANNLYQLMYKYCERGPLNKSRALYKTGNSHFAMGNSQHALHYYEQALALCDDEFVHLMEDIKYGIALSVQNSPSSMDLEKGRKHFQQSIDSLKTRIQECLQHHKFLPRELLQKLDNSFQGIQTVLAKLGCDAECLEYTEDSRIFATRLTSKAAVFSRLPLRLDFNALSSIVKSQGATILYYSFLPNSLLIWLLSPEKGLHRFYVKKPQKLTGSVEAELKALLDPWLCSLEKEYSKSVYRCEQRFVQRKLEKQESSALLEKRLKSSILKRGSSWSTAERKNLVGQQTLGGESNESSDVLNTEDDSQNQIERKLYKFLVSPVDDILSKVVKKGNLIIIPDKVIGQVPFSQIRDLKGRHLGDRFNITYLSGLFALKLVSENQVKNLQLEDEVNFLRSQSSLGGYYRYLHASEIQYCEDGETAARSTKDRRKMANPRLDVILSSEVSNKSKIKQPEENLALDNTRKMAGEEAHVTGCLVQLATSNEPVSRSNPLFQTQNSFYSIGRPISPRCRGKTTKLQSQPEIPQPCYHRSGKKCGQPLPVCKLLRTENLSTLITTSSTGTDALTSTTDVPEYCQVSNKETFVVIGSPSLSSRMMLGVAPVPVPASHASKLMKAELEAVSTILGCEYIFDKQATKEKFLEEASKATVLHIVSQANLDEGYIVMSCSNDKLMGEEPISEKYYLVTVEDISKVNMKAKLVVISGGWAIRNLRAEQGSLHTLPNAFILAGAESVLTLPHPQSSETFSLFLRLFYSIFQQSCDVCRALNVATRKVASHSDLPLFPAYLYGNNVTISICDIKSAMLDQNIDSVEAQVSSQYAVPPLNEAAPATVPALSEQLTGLQKCLSDMCTQQGQGQMIIESTLQLVKDATTVVEENILQVPNMVVLPHCLMAYSPAIELLKILRFDFEPRGLTQKMCEPAVHFPSWDPDGLLRRVSSALQSLLDIDSKEILTLIQDILPLPQDLISNFIDMLSLTLHSTDLQFETGDSSLLKLWADFNCRSLLRCVGFRQIGNMIHFNSTRENQSTLKPILKLFINISLSKPDALISKLDVSLLSQNKQNSSDERECEQLPTILPVLLPKDKLLRRVPWSSAVEDVEEMVTKKSLASKYWKNKREFNLERSRLAELQLSTAKIHAQELLRHYSLPRRKSAKVKVQAGSTASKGRVSVDYIPPLTASQFEQRKKYSDYLRRSRFAQIDVREARENKKLLHRYADVTH